MAANNSSAIMRFHFLGYNVTQFANDSQLIQGPGLKRNGEIRTPNLVPFTPEGSLWPWTDWIDYFVTAEEQDIRGEKAALAVATVITVLGTAFVVARLFIRKNVLRNFFVDDWLIFGAMIFGILGFASWAPATVVEMKEKQWSITYAIKPPPVSYSSPYNFWDIHHVANVLSSTFTGVQGLLGRLSILYTFRRLATSHRDNVDGLRRLRTLIHSTSVGMVLGTTAFIWLQADPCWPPTGGKGLAVAGSKCIRSDDAIPTRNYMTLWQSIFNAVADLISFALPFVIFHVANVPQRRGLYALFSFGFGVFLISVFRAADGTETMRHIALNDRQSAAYDFWTTPYVFAFGEANGVMVGACLPVVAGQVKKRWRQRDARRYRDAETGLTNLCDKTYGTDKKQRFWRPR